MSSPDAATAARAVVVLYRHLEQATRSADISMAQYRLLLFLKEGPQRVGVLAKVSALSKATISLAVNAVRARGWVETAPDRDGRASVVSLTPAGEAKLAAFEADLAQAMDQALRPQDLTAIAEIVASARAAMVAQKEAWLKSLDES